MTFVIVVIALSFLHDHGTDGVRDLAPGLLDWLAILRTLITRATTVRGSGGRAHTHAVDQGSPLYPLVTVGEVTRVSVVRAPRAEHGHPGDGRHLLALSLGPPSAAPG